jgi:hypothetical protein
MPDITGTRRLFTAAMTLAASSFCLLLFQSITGIALPDGGRSLLWIIAPMIATNIVAVVLFVYGKKIIVIVFIDALTGFSLTFLLRKIIMAKYPAMNVPLNEATAVIASGFVAATVMFCFTAGRAFRRISAVLVDDAKDLNKEDLLIRLRAAAWAHPKDMNTEKTASYLLDYGIAAFLLAVAASIRYKNGSSLLFASSALFVLSSLCVFLLTRQAASTARWLLAERAIDGQIPEQWNRTILMMIAATGVISFAIPHSFPIIDESVIREFINRALAFFSVNPYQPGHYVPEQIITAPPSAETAPFHIPLRVRIIFLSIPAAHILCAIAGFAFVTKLRPHAGNAYAQFCVRRYLEWVKAAGYAREIARFLLLAITFPIRIFFMPKTSDEPDEYSDAVTFSFVKNFSELPDEKKAEIRAIVDGFLKLTRSAGRKGILYRYSLGPSEYIDAVKTITPCIAVLLDESASVINESRYSPRILSKETIDGFIAKIDVIIRTIDGENNEIQ